MARLAAPIVLVNVGMQAMGVVDALMVGRLGGTAIASVALGNLYFCNVSVFGIGLLLGLAALVCFCLVASGVYVLNDLLDLRTDRLHPAKRHRSFASGALPLAWGLIIGPVLALVGVAAGLVDAPLLDLDPVGEENLAAQLAADLVQAAEIGGMGHHPSPFEAASSASSCARRSRLTSLPFALRGSGVNDMVKLSGTL